MVRIIAVKSSFASCMYVIPYCNGVHVDNKNIIYIYK